MGPLDGFGVRLALGDVIRTSSSTDTR
ncbi:hypothetical protein SMF913_25451 [Streptomyces malaysiensis]|uniref:Uncharacterized protein n=1 Tax=Streptomyces malaysiensis TaxID=92644 RepID=A0A2J7YPP0_STRMQ|nr:hypothetical protein SMF913_25451 [Streptomyces malaysiensis]